MIDAGSPTSIRDEALAFLLSSPTPDQIMAFRASDEAQERLSYLLEACRTRGLSKAEQTELDDACQITHLFKLLKARAQAVH